MFVFASGCGFAYRNTVGLFDSQPQQAPFKSPAEQSQSGAETSSIPAEPPKVTEVSPSSTQDSAALIERAPQQAKASSAKPSTGIELLWEIPKDGVDGYIIRYGYSREKLELSKRVPAANLERFEDAKLGFVYRYVLPDIAENSSVFVSLTAYSGDRLSQASPVFELKK